MHSDTIVALATPSGSGAIAVIRLSGPDAISIASIAFKSVSNKDLKDQPTHTIHLGHIVDDKKKGDLFTIDFSKELPSAARANQVNSF